MGACEYQERNEANWMKFWMATMETFIKNQKKEDMQSWGDVFNFGYVQFNKPTVHVDRTNCQR